METVHFTQQTFRAIMECFASPGELKKLDVQLSMAGLYDATASLCITLLDGEVSYFSFSEGDIDIQAWTGAKKLLSSWRILLLFRRMQQKSKSSEQFIQQKLAT